MWKTLTSGLMLIGLTGCLQTKDELTLNADGSGKVRIETRTAAGANRRPPQSGIAAGMGGEGTVFYPPASPDKAKKFFPGKDFVITAKQTNAENGDSVTVIEAEFKDINALLASPYGRAHQLAVELDKDGLVVRGITGMETAARMAEMKDESGMMGMMGLPGLAGGDAQKRTGEMRAEFRITLPNPVTTSNGARDGKTAAWTVERAKCKDAADFAQQLGVVARGPLRGGRVEIHAVDPRAAGACSRSRNWRREPARPRRRRLTPTKSRRRRSLFLTALTVTRAVDLSGKGGMNESRAQLIGAVVVPPEFAPQKWGEPALQEAVDAKGNDLKPKAGAEGEFSGRISEHYSDGRTTSDDEDPPPTPTTDVRHVVTFSFRPPDWKVKEIGRVKGSVTLHYFAGAEVVKLTNAIPANWLMNMAQAMGGGGGMDMAEKHLNSPRLGELGLAISVQMGMVQSGMTMLELQIKGSKGALVDAQAFDADGKPWPTFMETEGAGMDESTFAS